MYAQKIAVTTDCVIFFRKDNKLKILLIQRKAAPFKKKWALPGGFLEEKEPLIEGAKRELEEETGLKIEKLTQLKAFGAPGRDPRGRTITIAFLGETIFEEKVTGRDDALNAAWFEIEALPELAFDHKEIIQEALNSYS